MINVEWGDRAGRNDGNTQKGGPVKQAPKPSGGSKPK